MCLKFWNVMHFLHRRSRRAAADDSPEATSSSTSRLFTSGDSFSMSSRSTSSIAKSIVRHGPLVYKLSEIADATLNFATSQQIGSSAWKGMLRNSCVAIIQKPGVAQNFRRSLRNVCAMHHRNLAQVVGGCRTADCVFVVYEFVDGVDLQACLCNTLVPGYTVLSTWRLRMQVALDVAKGLEYVHQLSVSHLAHKYLTSSSVLLTKDTLRAKLGLVGMAVLTGEVVATDVIPYIEEAVSPSILNKEIDACERQESDISSERRSVDLSRSIKIKGIRGYMPPEYISSGAVSPKYDVFTYGIVLLELLKGQGAGAQRGIGRKKILHSVSIVDEVRSLMENKKGMTGRLRLWMDSRLKDSYPVEDAVKVVFLALSCVSDNPQKRPPMSDVALQMAIFLDSAEVWEIRRTNITESGTLEGR